ncbi:MAG: sensor domain-containing diguanylate cyclase [Candidatus Eremiobacteraeota bacterium]|nr:sensor domain-containing diguanylate cyclase [Candidatus Eremiobacteraeota bacterium]MCW5871178.1 sensor domain-containing diguanylate cyclase [Candidatus Eremiobacteraeota bacterium]
MPSSKKPTTEVATLAPAELANWVDHLFQGHHQRAEPLLHEVFESILWAANQYVPSECGSICLSGFPDAPDELVFVASFGESSGLIPGTRLKMGQGITGKVYETGKAQLRNDVSRDRNFYAGVDERTQFVTRSILSVPIVFDGEECGVLSLVNRRGKRGFRRHDLRLMQIFCGYLSTSIRNSVDSAFHREMALRDDLSGLRNDRYFYKQLLSDLEGCDRYGGDLSLIFMDLDHFKSVVDEHGHLVGSQVLAEVGHLLAETVEHPGCTLARYGGDEYVVVLPGADPPKAQAVAEKIRLAVLNGVFLTEPGAEGRPALHLKGRFSASIGVASYRDSQLEDYDDLAVRRQQLIRIADEAMYRAKRRGKNQVCLGRDKAPH